MPFFICCLQEVWRKLADGPPTSWTYPLNLGSRTKPSTSRTTLSWLREVTILPWWKAREQKLHPPKQPRLWVTEKRTSSMAATPPRLSYMGWTSRA